MDALRQQLLAVVGHDPWAVHVVTHGGPLLAFLVGGTALSVLFEQLVTGSFEVYETLVHKLVELLVSVPTALRRLFARTTLAALFGISGYLLCVAALNQSNDWSEAESDIRGAYADLRKATGWTSLLW